MTRSIYAGNREMILVQLVRRFLFNTFLRTGC